MGRGPAVGWSRSSRRWVAVQPEVGFAVQPEVGRGPAGGRGLNAQNALKTLSSECSEFSEHAAPVVTLEADGESILPGFKLCTCGRTTVVQTNRRPMRNYRCGSCVVQV